MVLPIGSSSLKRTRDFCTKNGHSRIRSANEPLLILAALVTVYIVLGVL